MQKNEINILFTKFISLECQRHGMFVQGNAAHMKIASILATLGFALAATAVTPHAADLPRLWEVSGKNDRGAEGRFYLLAVTHNGLDVEYDDYFYKTVVPIAIKADVFLHEKARLDPPRIPACSTPLADTAENRAILTAARADVARAYYDYLYPGEENTPFSKQQLRMVQTALHLMADNDTKGLSEYGLIITMRIQLDRTMAKHPEKFPNLIRGHRADVADYLEQQRLNDGKTTETNQSVDSAGDLIDAYCDINGEHRGRYLQREIAGTDPANFVPLPMESLERANADFVASVERGALTGSLEDRADDELSRRQVCDRNDKWLVKMRQHLGKEIRFYALGASHLLQPTTGNADRCDGLVVRLRQEGFTVTLIR